MANMRQWNWKLDTMGKNSGRVGAIAVAVALAFHTVGGVQGEGLRNPPPGTFGLGRSGGKIAHIDNASAVTHNPANLVDLRRPQFSFEPNLVLIGVEYDGPTGRQSAETHSPSKILPSLFAASPFADGQGAIGLGLTMPYGISNDWETDGAFGRPNGRLRYAVPHFAELVTINANPTIAWQLGNNVSIAAGLDVMYSEITFEQFYPWAAVTGNPATPDGQLDARGDGIGVGANGAVTWRFLDRHRLAATIRSPIEVDYDGDFRVSGIPRGVPGIRRKSDFETEIEFPTIVGVGYGLELTDAVRIGTDFEWLEFSNFDRLPIGVGSRPPGVPSSIPQDWHDTFTWGVGGDWQFSERWTLRGSYHFFESPIPEETFSPTIPGADQNALTIGVSHQRGRHSFDASYGIVLYDDRSISSNQNPALNGDYEMGVHLFSFAYRYKF